ncbi:hypothetical protein A2853_02755 [Candidatus Kaiserbacteria bacterium RIFCSPHIGHO2_01_FULL_55_17]|uniref:Uncharacterized protein n=1 Tax=Candidatus Kaiserbacteria bacterium RIFCSPHIGHO2_01_FULL_55_17 TaxID=1798484 RepID=A0A1F6D8F0_9BACT|nr:MAG: hypothetical protein A2853_02755 [Candidatus Kaiserbacteria bacterium RIFCSPHIGHO2_01_FULL_55_17]
MRRTEQFWKPEKNKNAEVREEIKSGITEHTQNVSETAAEAEAQYAHELHTTDEFARRMGEDQLGEIYSWYSSAMKRRGLEPLPEGGFMRHFFDGGSLDPTAVYGNSDCGYILGIEKSRLFVPTHLAPRTLTGAYSLLEELGAHKEIPVLMAITQDLARTVSLMPNWQVLDLGTLASFRSNIVKKYIAYNSHPETPKLATGLLEEYAKNTSDPVRQLEVVGDVQSTEGSEQQS